MISNRAVQAQLGQKAHPGRAFPRLVRSVVVVGRTAAAYAKLTADTGQ